MSEGSLSRRGCLALVPTMCLVACASDRTDAEVFESSTASATTGVGSTGSASTTGTGSGESGSGASDPQGSDTSDSSGSSGVTTGAGSSDSSGVRFDIGGNTDLTTSGGDDGTKTGCEKVDFLFVIDNSGSMTTHQINLISAFGPFVDTIYDRLPAQDFRIMVVDSDAGEDINSGCEPCSPNSFWCTDWCTAKNSLDVACETTLGAGEVAPYNNEASNRICGVPDGKRYLTSALPKTEIKDKFACIAKVGTFGSGWELPMTAMGEAVTTQNQAGGCNESFVRDDAVLVVTVISDDIPTQIKDNASVVGTPQEWFDAVVSAKRGTVNNIVMLAIINDENAWCIPTTDGVNRTGPTTRFLEFVAMFGARGVVGNVCDPNYDGFFQQAVGLIDTACKEFVPPE